MYLPSLDHRQGTVRGRVNGTLSLGDAVNDSVDVPWTHRISLPPVEIKAQFAITSFGKPDQ
jgi:hypothetical protein